MENFLVPEIEAYAEQHSMPESEVCRALREETERSMELARMLVGSYEAAFLKMMVLLTNARRVLEIGMFTGYSALSMAEMLPDNGELITCEVDAEPIAMARRYFAQSPHGRKIQIKPGPALESIRGLTGHFDVIFIDADKQSYVDYLKLSIELSHPGTVILADNVIRSGHALADDPPDAPSRGVKAFNEAMAAHPRLDSLILPIIRERLDGLSISIVK